MWCNGEVDMSPEELDTPDQYLRLWKQPTKKESRKEYFVLLRSTF